MVVLPRTDPYLENEKEFAHVDILWLANLVDTINEAMTQLETQLNSIDARLTAGGL